MSSLINYQHCPACGSQTISKKLSAVDYTVSKSSFDIWECTSCTLRFTQNIPTEDGIGAYYQSADYVSHSDTQEGIINKLYHAIRYITLQQKKKLIVKSTGLSKGNLLDLGAGTGAFANTMKEAGWVVTGLEPDETARKVAQNKLALTLDSPDKLFTLAASSFDVITMWHVLEHVHNLHGYLEQYFNILKPNGKLIIAVPNYTSRDAENYKEYWAAYDVPRHLYHFSPESMRQLAIAKGFKIEKHHPMWFDSFYVSMLSEKYKTGNQNLIDAAFNGLFSNLRALGNNSLCSSVIYTLSKS